MPTHNETTMERIKPRWRVCKRNGAWRIYDRGTWFDTYILAEQWNNAQ